MIELAMMYGILVGRVHTGPYIFHEDYLYRGNIWTVAIDTE
jgi:hypothetical protein